VDEVLSRIPHLLAARYPLLWIVSAEEERVERGLERVGQAAAIAVYRWRRTVGLQAPNGEVVPNTESPLHLLAAIPKLEGSAIFVLADFHDALGETGVVRRLRDLERVLGARKQALIVLSHLLAIPAELEKDFAVLDVPLPNRTEVGKLLAVLAQARKLEIERDLFEQFVTASLGLTEKEIKRAYARVLLDGSGFAAADVELVLDEKARLLRKSRFLEFVKPDAGILDVGGMGNLKEWLVHRQAGFSDRARAFGLPAPKGLFLLGVQGCGKSLSAKAVADLWRIPLLRLDVAALFSGRAEEGLRDTIRIAESLSPVVLWIDEIEKAFLQDAGTGRVFGAFLTWMQEKTLPVFVVATANEVRALPPELLRKGRFDEIFFVDLPNVHERLEILEIHIRRRGRNSDDYDLLQLAEETEKFSGAELEQLIIAALFTAFSLDRELIQEDLVRVARDSIPLAVTMDDRLKELRDWARPRARPASVDTRRISFFEDWESG
jgi:SpoVK/Ycf46/Vps4 family AAA+-type ATPase